MHETPLVLSLGQIFTLLFVMLGPLKIIGPFARLTHEMDEKHVRRIALFTFAIGLLAAIVGGLVGRALLANWQISPPDLLLAGGLIFFVVGMRLVLEQYDPRGHAAPPTLPPSPMAAAMRITFPSVVTPYGTAALIVLLVNSHSPERTLGIIAILTGVMLLNLLAMLFARRILGGVTAMALEILGAVLGVLQVALAVTMIVRALHGMGVLHAG